MNRILLSLVGLSLCLPLAGQDKPEPTQVQWNNVTLGQVTEAVQRRTKKTFLIDEVVENTFMKKKVRFLSDRPIASPEEMFAIYKSILQVNGLSLVPAGKEGEEIWKIRPTPEAGRLAVPIDDGSKSPTDSYVTRIFSFKYVDVKQAHTALLSIGNPQGIVMIESAGIIVVTDFDHNLKRFEKIIELLDIEKPDIGFKLVQLKNALASDVEQMLNNLVQTLIQRTAGRMQPGQGTGGPEGVKIVADKRTNSILVLAEQVRMRQLLDLVQQLDTQAPFETSGIYIEHLRHTNAADISKTLNALYKINVDDKGLPSGGSTVRPGAVVGPAPASTGAGAGSQQLTGTEPTIVADSRSNSLIIITDRNTYRTLVDIIKRLDQVRPQVLITATVVEVRTEGDVDIGVELNRAVDPEGYITTFMRSQFGQSTAIPTGNTVSIVPLDTAGATLALVKDSITNIGAMLKAKQSKLSVDVLDQPEATASDNGKAIMTVKQQVPVLQTTITGTGLSTTTFKEFVEAATTLEISPHISEGGYLRLEAKVKIEKFTGVSANQTIPPPKSTREIETSSIRIASGRTVVLGGIVTQDKTDSVDGIPYLSEIPILGALFRRTRQTDVKRTLYIFITPYILYDENQGDLKELTGDRKELIQEMRSEALRNLNLEGRGEPAPFSTYRYRRPSEWDVFVDEPK